MATETELDERRAWNERWDKLEKLAKSHHCACGGGLTVAVTKGQLGLRCGKCEIVDEASIVKRKGLMRLYEEGVPMHPAIENRMQARREKELTQELGTKTAQAVQKYQTAGPLTRVQAKEILTLIWPGAPEVERVRAAILCEAYRLNPLMKHVFLMPFKTKDGGTTWATHVGIKASRLMAARKHRYGYTDGTPRIMTPDEQERTFGEVDKDSLVVIVKLRDEHGNIIPGYGKWPLAKAAYGEDKGNSRFNMASIRAERQALDRLAPGEIPEAEVGAEEYADIPVTVIGPIINGETGEVLGPHAAEGSPQGEQAASAAVAQGQATPTSATGRPAGLITDAQKAEFRGLDWSKTFPPGRFKSFEDWAKFACEYIAFDDLTEKQAASWLSSLMRAKAGKGDAP